MRKPIGSQWMLNPNLAGYGNVWQPGVVTIHHYVMPEDEQPPTKNGVTPPRRQYVVTMPGGLFLFANDECLSEKNAPPPVVPAPDPVDFRNIERTFPQQPANAS